MDMKIRLATVDDAKQLLILNDEFNGKGETTLEKIRDSLVNNQWEVVIVSDEKDVLAGFICVQIKKSFCYTQFMMEVTEVYVKQEYRNRGYASAMIGFAEDYVNKKYPLQKFELLTGKNNFTAQSVYHKLGYKEDGEIHLSKQL